MNDFMTASMQDFKTEFWKTILSGEHRFCGEVLL